MAFNYFLFSLSPLTKEELKRYKSLECFYGQLPDYQSQVLAYSTKQMSSTFCSCCSFSSDLHSSERGGALVCVECL